MKKGDICRITPEDIEGAFEISRLNVNPIMLRGFFSEILPSFAQNSDIKIAFLNLDVDLGQSYKECLENLFPLVVEGGVVVFDEYMGHEEERDFGGAKKAIDEYFGTDYKIQRDEIIHKYYLIK